MINKPIEENVRFTGKEYLAYLKYKDSKPKFSFSDWLDKGNNTLIFGVSSILIIALMCFVTIYNVYTYQPPTPFNFTWNGVQMFIVICVGLSWVIHGVGFQLVRVR